MTSVTTECSGVQPNVTDPANLSAVVGSLSADAGDGLPVAGYDSPAKNVKNPSSGTPLTPTANLKVLVAAASSALDREKEECAARKLMFKGGSGGGGASEGEGNNISRKMKSLSLLCKRFLEVADNEVGTGKEFSLEMMATSLATNRRRIYDIINVMEALEMISKQSKNWYLWHGRGNLTTTLAKFKAGAMDDPDIKPYLDVPEDLESKENMASSNTPGRKSFRSARQEGVSEANRSLEMDAVEEDELQLSGSGKSVRYDKSLGVLCRKFVTLFLILPGNDITLEEAGRILIPDYQDDALYYTLNSSVNSKSKVRRLYDIANILTSMDLIKKKVFVVAHHLKKSGYCWSGPSVKEIDQVCSTIVKKNRFPVVSLQKWRLQVERPDVPQLTSRGHAVVWRDSYIENRGRERIDSTDETAMLASADGLRTVGNMSESETANLASTPVHARQRDYIREVKEFGAELLKHSHRYPHIAPVFQEFLRKYQATLEQEVSPSGRLLLPKTVTLNLQPILQVEASASHSPATTTPSKELASPKLHISLKQTITEGNNSVLLEKGGTTMVTSSCNSVRMAPLPSDGSLVPLAQPPAATIDAEDRSLSNGAASSVLSNLLSALPQELKANIALSVPGGQPRNAADQSVEELLTRQVSLPSHHSCGIPVTRPLMIHHPIEPSLVNQCSTFSPASEDCKSDTGSVPSSCQPAAINPNTFLAIQQSSLSVASSTSTISPPSSKRPRVAN